MLICVFILLTLSLIIKFFDKSFKSKIFKLTKKLYPKEDFFAGDTISLSPSKILPSDCMLLDPSAIFTPVFSSSAAKPTEFFQGDIIPGGFRLISETPVNLSVISCYNDSTFVKYLNAFENSIKNLHFPIFYGKMLLYLFQKGVLISGNLKKFAKTKIFYISNAAAVKSDEYTVEAVFPSKTGITENALLKYAAKAEIPYRDTPIGNALFKKYDFDDIFLSSVTSTQKRQKAGISTCYGSDKILAGNKDFMILKNVRNLPDFNETEVKSTVSLKPDNIEISEDPAFMSENLYFALNGEYIGYISFHAPLKSSYNDFIKYLHKRHIKTILTSGNFSDKDSENFISVRKELQKKHRTGFIAYTDSKPSDNAISVMSDYNIYIGTSSYCKNNDFTDITVITDSYKPLLRAAALTKRVRKTVSLYTAALCLLTAVTIFVSALIAAGFITLSLKIWHIVLIYAIIFAASVKIYDFLFRFISGID